MHELFRAIYQWSLGGRAPHRTTQGADSLVDGLDAFISEDEPSNPPGDQAGPSLTRLVVVVGVFAVVGALGAFVSRPFWTASAEAASADGTRSTSSLESTETALIAPSEDLTTPEAAAPVPQPAGQLLIDTDPPGARVSVDREWIGVSPITVANLSAGSHEVVVESPRGRVARTVHVRDGSEGSLVIAMPAANRFVSGWVSVTTAIPLEIRENGILVGSTAAPRVLLPAGRHELELTNARLGFQAVRTVQVTAGQTAVIDLETPSGTVFVNARPWAEVFVDGRRVGETPIANLSLPIGERELVFRHPQLGERRQTIVVGLDEPTRIGVELDR